MRKGLSPESIPKLAFLLLLALTPLLLPAKVVGTTYDESGWYLYSEGDLKQRHFADIRVLYSVPDRVEMGQRFDINASLTYIGNNNAHCEWIEFFDVGVHLRTSPTGQDAASALDASLLRARPGKQYAHRFTLVAPTTVWPQQYYVTLTWRTNHPTTWLGGLWGSPINIGLASEEGRSWDTGRASPEAEMRLPRIVVEKNPEMTLTFQVTLDTEPRDVGLKVNGTSYAGDSLPRTFEWDPASLHILQVDKTVEDNPGIRFVFVEWSDGSKETTRAIITLETANYTARFKTQYKLTVISDIGDPQGEGWYDSGSEATISVDSTVPEKGLMGPLGAKKTFQKWSGDLTSDSRTATITMDGPKTVEAEWTAESSEAYTILGVISAAGLVLIAAAFMLTRRRRRARPQIRPFVTAPPRVPPPAPPVARAPTTYPPRLPAQTGVKYCVHCGATIPSVVPFCTECGKKQE